jgi:hypothetical protein
VEVDLAECFVLEDDDAEGVADGCAGFLAGEGVVGDVWDGWAGVGFVEGLAGGWGDEFGLAGEVGEVELCVCREVLDVHVDGACGAHDFGVVGVWAGGDGDEAAVFELVAPGLVGVVGEAELGGWAKAGGFQVQGKEDFLTHESLPGLCGRRFEHEAGEEIAEVAVLVGDAGLGGGAGVLGGFEVEGVAEDEGLLLGEGVRGGQDAEHERVGEVGGLAGAVGQEHAEGDGLEFRLHLVDIAGEGGGEGGVPMNGAGIDEARGKDGGHGFGA